MRGHQRLLHSADLVAEVDCRGVGVAVAVRLDVRNDCVHFILRCKHLPGRKESGRGFKNKIR